MPLSEFLPVSSPCTMKVICTFIHPLSSDIFQGIPCVQCSCLEHYMSLAHPSGPYTTLLSSSVQRQALQFERRLKTQSNRRSEKVKYLSHSSALLLTWAAHFLCLFPVCVLHTWNYFKSCWF